MLSIFFPLLQAIVTQPVKFEIKPIVQEVKQKTVDELIREYFGEYSDEAVEVARCENRKFDSTKVNEIGCVGIFQIYAKYHNTTIEEMQDPEKNIKKAYEIFSNDNFTWNQWSCKPY